MGPDLGDAMMGLVCQAVFGSLISAVILWAACAWYNSMVGRSRGTSDAIATPAEAIQFPPSSNNPYEAPTVPARWQTGSHDVGVPDPSFGKAWLISFVMFLANTAVGFIAGEVLDRGGAALGIDGNILMLLSLLIIVPLFIGVAAGLLAVMLPTSIGRAVIVTLLHLAITTVVGIAIWIAVLGAMFLLGRFN